MFDFKNFMPHGHNYFWRPDTLWLHAASDALMTLAGLLIPLALGYFFYKRKKAAQLEELNRTLEARVDERVKDSLRLAAIVKNSHDAIFSKDLAGRILSWNEAAQKIFGYSAEEIVGDSVFKIVPESLRQHEDAVLLSLQNGENLDPFETVRLSKDGREIPVSISISPMKNAQGEVFAASSIVRDITQKKEMDRQLKEVTDMLKERNKQLTVLDKAKDEFIANLSHELRSPLNVIIGYSDIIETLPSDSDDFGNAVDVIKRNAETQLRLVEDLLDMSRIVSGKFSLETEEADIRNVAENALKTVEFAARTKKIEIVKRMNEDETKVVCDADRIQQVLWNLLSNAVKFTPEGGRVVLSAHREGGNLVVDVEDNGIGIDPSELTHVFDRWWQTNQSVESNKAGLGLGLRISKDLVEAHGGTLKAYSEGQGKGARFRMSLPIQAVAQEVTPRSKVNRTPLMGLTILVVDDAIDAVELVRIVLENAGAKVITAYNGAQALELIRQSDVQLIISDINMPVMDGYRFMEQTREFEKEVGHVEGRPAIALTARTGPGERERAYQAGYQLHLVKPVKPAVLIDKVMSVVGKR